MMFRTDLSDLVPYTAGQTKPGAIKLSSNENPLGPSPRAAEAVRAMVGEMHRYPDGSAAALKERLARLHGLEPRNFVLGNGSDEVLTLVAASTIAPGANAVTASSTFSEYTFAARLFGGAVRKAPLREGRFDLGALLSLVDAKTRVVFLCNPNNPTGTYNTHDEVEDFLRNVPAQTLVVLDEAYSEYATAPDFPQSGKLLARFPNLIVLRTFSKIYGLASLRVGYAMASPETALWLERVRQPFNNGNLAQAGALAALDDEAYLAESLRVNKEGMAVLSSYFSSAGVFFYPSQTNFLCVNTARDAKTVFLQLMDLGVAVRPLGSFGMPEWVRVTVGTPDQVAFFLEAWKKISN